MSLSENLAHSTNEVLPSKREPIHVIIGIDHEYARGAAAMVRSLLNSTQSPERIQVHVLDTGLTDEDRVRLRDSWRDAPRPMFVRAPSEPLSQVGGVAIASHVTVAGYARLFIPDVFPHLEQVLWLDSDLIIQDDIVDLWEHPLQGEHEKMCAIGAVRTTPLPISARVAESGVGKTWILILTDHSYNREF